jgi:hypothetical protein
MKESRQRHLRTAGFCLFLICAHAALTTPAYSEPNIQGPTFVALDHINSSKPVKGTVTFSNIGNEPLELKGFARSCSCINLVLPKEKVAPGASFAVEFTVDPQKSKANQVSFSLKSNDPNVPILTTMVHWKGGQAFLLDPTALYLVKEGKEAPSGVVTLHRAAGVSLKVLDVRTSAPWLSAKLVRDNGRLLSVEVHVSEDAVSDLRGEVTLSVDGKAFKEISIPVVVTQKRWYSVYPQKIASVVASGREGSVALTPDCTLHTSPGTTISVSSSSPYIEASVESSADGATHKIHPVLLSSKAAAEQLEFVVGKLQARQAGSEEVCEIPISVMRVKEAGRAAQ